MLDMDFEYDGIYLSDFGFMVCNLNGNEEENISEGSEISFNLTPVAMGKRQFLAGTKYDSSVTAEFDICKNPCEAGFSDYTITYDEEREIVRWLSRHEMLPLRLLSEHYEDIIFEGSFNV